MPDHDTVVDAPATTVVGLAETVALLGGDRSGTAMAHAPRPNDPARRRFPALSNTRRTIAVFGRPVPSWSQTPRLPVRERKTPLPLPTAMPLPVPFLRNSIDSI